MQSINLATSELKHTLSAHDVLQEVANQVFKDLGAYAPNASAMQEHLNVEWLLKSCERVMIQLYRHHYSDLLSIMYRADVKETEYQKVLSAAQLSEEETSKKLTLLLLNRELMKVLTRKAYAQEQKKRT